MKPVKPVESMASACENGMHSFEAHSTETVEMLPCRDASSGVTKRCATGGGGDGTGTRAWADDDSAAVFAPFAFARRRDVPGALGRVRADARMRLGAHARRLGSACARRAHRAASTHDAPRRARILGDGERGTTGCDEVFLLRRGGGRPGALPRRGDGESFDSRGDGDDEVGRGRRAGGGGGETIDRGVRVVRGVTMTCSGSADRPRRSTLEDGREFRRRRRDFITRAARAFSPPPEHHRYSGISSNTSSSSDLNSSLARSSSSLEADVHTSSHA